MKKLALLLLIFIGNVHANELAEGNTYYRQEFKALTQNDKYKLVFDTDASFVLRDLKKDIKLYKNISLENRVGLAITPDVVLITPDAMPKLYRYIDGLCKKFGIDTPAIFISMNKGMFNAFAAKILWYTGSIVIGQDILLKSSDDAIEGVLAHEVGHIYHGHVNKTLLARAICLVPSFFILSPLRSTMIRGIGTIALSSFTVQLIIDKKFEWQADEFACKQAQKSKGLVDFLSALEHKEDDAVANFEKHLREVYEDIQSCRQELSYVDYIELMCRYYAIKANYKVGQGYKWLYYNTPFGSHPKTQERIKKAEQF